MMMPSTPALPFRSARHETGDAILILAVVHLYRILQLIIFVRRLFTGAPRRPVNTGSQGNKPSPTPLTARLIKHARGNCNPIYPRLLAVLLLVTALVNSVSSSSVHPRHAY
jgi:hypothetical protein